MRLELKPIGLKPGGSEAGSYTPRMERMSNLLWTNLIRFLTDEEGTNMGRRTLKKPEGCVCVCARMCMCVCSPALFTKVWEQRCFGSKKHTECQDPVFETPFSPRQEVFGRMVDSQAGPEKV